MRAAAILAATLAALAPGPRAKAQWTLHTSFNGATMAAVAAGKAVAGNSYGLTYYDPAEGLTSTLDKANHLSSSGISAIKGDGDILVVGYANGDIDLVDMAQMTTYNIPELRLSTKHNDKAVNSITPAGSQYYIGFGGGVLEVDGRKAEIKSAWSVTADGADVRGVALTTDHIYAATATGIYRARRDSRLLEDPGQWSLLTSPRGNTLSLAAMTDTVYAAVGRAGGDVTLWKITADGAEATKRLGSYRSMSARGGKLLVTRSGGVDLLGAGLAVEATVTTVGRPDTADAVAKPQFRMAEMIDGKTLAIADNEACLIISDTAGMGKAYKPNGPLSNISSCITAAGDDIYAGGPGRNGELNNQGNPASVSVLRDGVWHSSAKTWADSREPCMVAANPRDPSDVFLSTWGTGIFKIVDCQLDTQFTAGNSTIKDIFGGNRYVRSDAITFDEAGNLYVLACVVDSGVNVMTPEGEWHSYPYGPMGDGSTHSYAAMAAAPNGNIWVASTYMSGTHTSVFNIGGTPESCDDDLYMSTRGDEADKQYVGRIELVDSDTGEAVGDRANAFAIDADGNVWVGMSAGLLVTKDNKTMLQTGSVTFNRIKVPRNDGTNLADYLLDGAYINAIAVDGANRKWIGTDEDGAYLVSADGTQTIRHFTAANSPLPSDKVEGVAIRQSDGEIFFSTPYGIASYKGDATEPSESLASVRIYPNPFSLRHGPGAVSIDRLMGATTLFITDVAGNRVARLTSVGGKATWDGRRPDGRLAAAGIYIVWMTASNGDSEAVGKLLVTD